MTTTENRITAAELRRAIDDDPDIWILDVRTGAEFETAHIPGAVNVPLNELGRHAHQIATMDRPAIIVCQSGNRACEAEKALVGKGMLNLAVLEGGMNAWEKIGGDVNRGQERWALERQVRLVAGSIVLAATAASLKWPKLRFLAGGVGAGLAFAAITNTCAMGNLLARLPYNQGPQPDVEASLARVLAEARSARPSVAAAR